jgi:hypothetical protein
LFSPQIFSKSLNHSQNKETELKGREREEEEEEEEEEVLKKGKKIVPKVSHEKRMNIFRDEKNISTSYLFCVGPSSLFLSILTHFPNYFEKFLDSFRTIP